MRLPNAEVRVAGAENVRRGSLRPTRAFHPKMYLFFARDAATALVGSANLTSRGLTVNTEAVWLQHGLKKGAARRAWRQAIEDTVAMDEELLQAYERLRKRSPPTPEQVEIEPVPPPHLPDVKGLPLFPDAVAGRKLEPEKFGQMWVQVEKLQGGSGNQLELPRGAHRFFGFRFNRYDSAKVEHIGNPTFVSGAKTWADRPLTWHGDNGMERINLPTASQSGLDYRDSAILFRRLRRDTFELTVAQWDRDLARGWVEASVEGKTLYRLGARTGRLVGLI